MQALVEIQPEVAREMTGATEALWMANVAGEMIQRWMEGHSW